MLFYIINFISCFFTPNFGSCDFWQTNSLCIVEVSCGSFGTDTYEKYYHLFAFIPARHFFQYFSFFCFSLYFYAKLALLHSHVSHTCVNYVFLQFIIWRVLQLFINITCFTTAFS